MTFTVDIRPEVEAELARQAAMRGTPVAAYAAGLIEEAVHLSADARANAGKQMREGRKSLVEVCAMVGGLANDVDFSRDPSPGRPVDLT